jgi:tRNA modification GTPase
MACDSADTIAAIASAPGGAYRGVVRCAGSQCVPVVSQVFAPLAGQPDPMALRTPRRVAGRIDLGPPLGIVPADLLLWPGNRSYTRQPSAEIHTVGSPPILEAILARLGQAGARIARPGEFTLRAFLAGRIDLTQAEAVLGVIDARDQRELDVALAQLAGGLAGPLGTLRENLLDLLAHLEAGLDFVDEDIEFISPGRLECQLTEAARQIDALAEQMQRRGITQSLPRVVLIGEPNAGKSSLFNALRGTPAALVSEIAGTTRDYVSGIVRCGRLDVEFIDTAGIDERHSAGPIDSAAQAVAHAQAEHAALTLVCVDASRPATPWELRQLSTHDGGVMRWIVRTKCDAAGAAPASSGGICTSSRTREGIEELKAAIETALSEQSADVAVVAGTAARCRESLLLAAESLRRARQAAAELGEEFAASEVRSALDDLGRVVGAVYSDDVLDRIFSRFCIGK